MKNNKYKKTIYEETTMFRNCVKTSGITQMGEIHFPPLGLLSLRTADSNYKMHNRNNGRF